jgi:DnaJ-class molecular chaperone
MSENFYEILGVNENASKDEIKKAYRVLQLKHHPDRNKNDPESVSKSQKISEAWETLGNDEKRKEYDFMRKSPFGKMNMASNMNMHMNMGVPLDEIFSTFFGGNPFQPQDGKFEGAKIHVFHNGVPMNGGVSFNGGMPFSSGIPFNFAQLQKPTPIIKTVTISLEQVMTGCTLPVDIERWINENGNKISEHETLYINIPKGADDNELIILRDKGNVVNETVKGDVKIFIKVANETDFKRNGLDLIFEKHISLKDALCGFSFQLEHVNGKVYTINNSSGSIVIPEYQKIMPNMGLERETHIGNLIIHFHIDFPEKLNEEQIKQLKNIL